MAIETKNALERFIAKTRDLFAEEPDAEKRWELMRPILAELLADPEVLEASKQWPDCVPQDGRAENLLFYEDSEFGFAINGLVKGEARRGNNSRIHDHAHIYTLYGVLDGNERIERWERVDDGSQPDYAEIRKASDVYVGRGEIDLVKPYEIHRELLESDRSVAVIIRSAKGGEFDQGRYDPETNKYWESPGPRQTPTEMLPKRSA